MLLGTVCAAAALLAGVRIARGPERYRDLAALLRGRSMPRSSANRLVAIAGARRYDPATLCRWAVEHDADGLALVIDAGVAEQALRDHLVAGTTPDWQALSVFAEIAAQERAAGMPAAELTDPDVVPLISDLLLLADLYDWDTARESGSRRSMPITTWEPGDGGEAWPRPL